MKEPWKSRRWYVDTANGDLVIPEVIRSDEGEYFCGDNAGARRVRLWVELSVQGEFFYPCISIIHDSYGYKNELWMKQ